MSVTSGSAAGSSRSAAVAASCARSKSPAAAYATARTSSPRASLLPVRPTARSAVSTASPISPGDGWNQWPVPTQDSPALTRTAAAVERLRDTQRGLRPAFPERAGHRRDYCERWRIWDRSEWPAGIAPPPGRGARPPRELYPDCSVLAPSVPLPAETSGNATLLRRAGRLRDTAAPHHHGGRYRRDAARSRLHIR